MGGTIARATPSGGARRRRVLAVLGVLAVVLGSAAPADAAPDLGPFPSARWFTWAVHVDLLGWFPGSEWWDAHTEAVQGGRTTAQELDAVLAGPEFGQFVAPVVRLYGAFFGRAPDTGGQRFWIRARRGGTPLPAVADAFAASAEFRDRYGPLDDGGFVDLVYRNLLGRSPDPGGRAFWVARLASGTSRGTVMTGFSESTEFRNRSYLFTTVATVYLGLLGRPPDPAGGGYWVTQLASGLPAGAFADALLRSPEYGARWAGGLPGPPTPRLRVAIWGDSLMWEAQPYIHDVLESAGPVEVRSYTWGGTTFCDWYRQIAAVRDEFDPHVVIFSFSGTALTDCMRGYSTGDAYFQKYLADAKQASSIAGAAGAFVYLVIPPTTVRIDHSRSPIHDAYVQAAASNPARITAVDGGSILTPGGVFHERLPCFAGEPCDADGMLTARSPDGIHFCPHQDIDAPHGCREHSGGALRYSLAITQVVLPRFGLG